MSDPQDNQPNEEDVQGHTDEAAEAGDGNTDAAADPDSEAKASSGPDDDDTEGHRAYATSNAHIEHDIHRLS